MEQTRVVGKCVDKTQEPYQDNQISRHIASGKSRTSLLFGR